MKTLARYIPLKKVVYLEPIIEKGTAMIDNIGCGISIEFDCRTKAVYASEKVTACLTHLGLLEGTAQKVQQEHYSAYGILKENRKNIPIVNFQETTIDGETFYPVLHNEDAYKDLLCLKARKIDLVD